MRIYTHTRTERERMQYCSRLPMKCYSLSLEAEYNMMQLVMQSVYKSTGKQLTYYQLDVVCCRLYE